MATTTMLDLRRSDQRNNVLENPYWISSASFTKTADDLAAVLFSFPATFGAFVIVHEIVCQVTTLWAGGTITLDIGACTIATDAVTTAGDTTDVDADEYIDTTDITSGTVGTYGPTTGNGSDWLTAEAARTWAAPRIITCAATTVPCIAAYVASDDTITGGAARVHALITVIPTV